MDFFSEARAGGPGRGGARARGRFSTWAQSPAPRSPPTPPPFLGVCAQIAKLARNTQLILAEETGVTRVADPLGGSFYVEALTAEMERMAEQASGGGVIGWGQSEEQGVLSTAHCAWRIALHPTLSATAASPLRVDDRRG